MDLLITNGTIVPAPGAAPIDGAVAIESGTIASIIHAGSPVPESRENWDVEGRLVTAGLVEPHTHLVYGGDRLDDFRRRLGGDDYRSIAESGGGIRSTVQHTRGASDAELLAAAVRRLGWLADSGCTTVEIKSGYGLDTDQELRMLRIARQAGGAVGVRVETCLLAAHVVPEGASKDDYLETVCHELIPAAAEQGLTTMVDVFVESIAFDASDARKVFEAAADHGMAVKAHVGQFSAIGGDALAAEFGAISIDHCEHLAIPSLPSLSEAGTVAVLVPGASFFLGDDALPPVQALREHRIPMAVSTDMNPGSSPVTSQTLAAGLAVHRFGLSPGEAFAGITSNAARALGLHGRRGRLEVGMDADIAVWEAASPDELLYWLGAPLCVATVVKGRQRRSATP